MIDLSDIIDDIDMFYRAEEVLALVRAVRAARAVHELGYFPPDWEEVEALDAALAPFTDSAEVRSDGE